MDRLAVRRGLVLLGVLMAAASACSSGDGNERGDDDARRDADDDRTDATVELVDDALLPESGDGSDAPSLITSDGGYVCSETQDVTVEGDNLRVGLSDECASVTIRGTGNEVDLWDAGMVTIDGTQHDVGLVSALFDVVVVNGDGNRVHLTAADSVAVNGTRNTIDVVNGYGPIALTGADHHIQVPTNGLTPVADRSVNSQIDGDYTEATLPSPPPMP